MSRECERCGATTSGHLSLDWEHGYDNRDVCDRCQDELRELVDAFLAGEDDPTAAATCTDCGDAVDVRVRPMGPTRGPRLLVACETCGWERSLGDA